MRHLALILCSLALTLPAAAVDWNLIGGVDLQGEIGSGDVSVDTDRGFSVGLEVEHTMIPNFTIGAGLEYLAPRDLDDGSGEVDGYSLYAVGRYRVLGPLYAVGRYGFSDLSLDQVASADELNLDSGTHWGVGAGVRLAKSLRVEVIYDKFDGDVDTDIGDVGVDFQYDYETTLARLVWTF